MDMETPTPKGWDEIPTSTEDELPAPPTDTTEGDGPFDLDILGDTLIQEPPVVLIHTPAPDSLFAQLAGIIGPFRAADYYRKVPVL
jgi:hypothetical protein